MRSVTDKKTDEKVLVGTPNRVHVRQDPNEMARVAALCSSVFLFLGGLSTAFAMHMDIHLIKQDSWFTEHAIESCKTGKSVLYGWPASVSNSIQDQLTGTSHITEAFLKTTAIFVVASRLGNLSTFPIVAGDYEALFNVFRVIAVFAACYLVPNIPVPLSYDYQASYAQLSFHCYAAFVTFLVCPLLEIIACIISFKRFFNTKPWGKKLLPTNDPSWPTKWHHKALIYLWMINRIIIIFVAVFAIFSTYSYIKVAYAEVTNPDAGDCYTMQYTKGYFIEVVLIAGVAAIAMCLATSQFCESSNGDGLRAGIIISATAITSYLMLTVFVPFAWSTYHFENDYRKLVGMEDDTTGIVAAIAVLAKKTTCTATLKVPSGGWSSCYA